MARDMPKKFNVTGACFPELHYMPDISGMEDGLSNNSINCFIQDKAGYIWIGTDNGLNRYDGYAFKVYKQVPGDTASLAGNTICSLYEDREGYLWVGTDISLHRYNPGPGTHPRNHRQRRDDARKRWV